MSDILLRAVAADGLIKMTAVSTRGLTEKARQMHRTLPVATAALGRALAAASMLGSWIKHEKGSLTFQINGKGPIGTVMAVSDSSGNVRGYVGEPHIDLPLRPDGKLNVGAAVGREGSLTVIRDLGFGEPYIGSVRLVSGEIAEDVAAYLVESEQLRAACALGVLVDTDQSVRAAGGYIIELLPGAPDGLIDGLEGAINAVGSVTSVLDGGTVEDLVNMLLVGFEPKILERREIEYRCNCSRERVRGVLVSLGKSDIEEIEASQEETEISCHFCNLVYRFTPEEVKEIAAEAKK
ncbi:MAG: Hsp33 family molecular chaperone HslO [Clostridiales bacterium]|nr:Hsp33 family molecular chaperone HslO [Clostridiales bacterium]